jgi:hypothetical protein
VPNPPVSLTLHSCAPPRSCHGRNETTSNASTFTTASCSRPLGRRVR